MRSSVLECLERDRAELAAALRKVTANLRRWVGEHQEMLTAQGVLEAEVLLKRIDDGSGGYSRVLSPHPARETPAGCVRPGDQREPIRS